MDVKLCCQKRVGICMWMGQSLVVIEIKKEGNINKPMYVYK